MYNYFMKLKDHLNKLDKEPRIHERIRLAQGLNVSVSSINHWANGRRKPNPDHTLGLERLTDGSVSRYDERPDVYPID